ncbi:hypothetical protein MMC29_006136 [Sticta canariensis]|nr:hypothetical protein [Sticta canariensis]
MPYRSTSHGKSRLDFKETNKPRGFAPFLKPDYAYPVYRNVQAYGAIGNGQPDDTDALQDAINSDGNGGSRYQNEVTTRPAEVFVPGGEYKISKTVDLRLNTILVGDLNDPPVFKASPGFSGGSLISGVDFVTDNTGGTTNFLVAIKNVVIDTKNIGKDQSVIALNWGVAQACQLTNIRIEMPNSSNGHIGIAMDRGSTTAVTDVKISGGAVGIRNGNQQLNFKDILFQLRTTAITFTGGLTAVIQGATFDTCGLGIDATRGNQLGSVIDNGPRSNQIVIDNLSHSGDNPVAVDSDGNVKLQQIDPAKTWIWGNVDPGGFQTGKVLATFRSGRLFSNGKFFTKAQPTYEDFSTDRIVNVKAVQGHAVKGDGATDDSASLNAILAENAATGKVSYFPYGVYIVKSLGGFFGDRNNPQAVVMVGNPGQTGIAQMQDMRFSVADIAPGAIILQVNMEGSAQGDVGIWNSHITVGGTADTNVNTACDGPNTADCLAAFAMLHLTQSSSCYIENMWGWTADHSLERDGHQNIATARGALIESMLGLRTSLPDATVGNGLLAGCGLAARRPQPMATSNPLWRPRFQLMRKHRPIVPHGLGTEHRWRREPAFFHGEVSTCYNCPATACGPNCIKNQARVTNGPRRLWWYGVNTRTADVMVLDGIGDPKQDNNPGGWNPGGVIAGYLHFSGSV